MSRKTPQTSWLLSKTEYVSCKIAISWFTQESLGLKLDRFFDRKLFIKRYEEHKLSKICRSKILLHIAKRETEW